MFLQIVIPSEVEGALAFRNSTTSYKGSSLCDRKPLQEFLYVLCDLFAAFAVRSFS